jgi:hypothetical protein
VKSGKDWTRLQARLHLKPTPSSLSFLPLSLFPSSSRKFTEQDIQALLYSAPIRLKLAAEPKQAPPVIFHSPDVYPTRFIFARALIGVDRFISIITKRAD